MTRHDGPVARLVRRLDSLGHPCLVILALGALWFAVTVATIILMGYLIVHARVPEILGTPITVVVWAGLQYVLLRFTFRNSWGDWT